MLFLEHPLCNLLETALLEHERTKHPLEPVTIQIDPFKLRDWLCDVEFLSDVAESDTEIEAVQVKGGDS